MSFLRAGSIKKSLYYLTASEKTTFQLSVRCGSTICQTKAHHLKMSESFFWVVSSLWLYLCSCVFLRNQLVASWHGCLSAGRFLRVVCLMLSYNWLEKVAI